MSQLESLAKCAVAKQQGKDWFINWDSFRSDFLRAAADATHPRDLFLDEESTFNLRTMTSFI